LNTCSPGRLRDRALAVNGAPTRGWYFRRWCRIIGPYVSHPSFAVRCGTPRPIQLYLLFPSSARPLRFSRKGPPVSLEDKSRENRDIPRASFRTAQPCRGRARRCQTVGRGLCARLEHRDRPGSVLESKGDGGQPSVRVQRHRPNGNVVTRDRRPPRPAARFPPFPPASPARILRGFWCADASALLQLPWALDIPCLSRQIVGLFVVRGRGRFGVRGERRRPVRDWPLRS